MHPIRIMAIAHLETFKGILMDMLNLIRAQIGQGGRFKGEKENME